MLSISSVMQDVSPLLAFKGKKIPFLQQKITNCNMKLKMTRFDFLIFKDREWEMRDIIYMQIARCMSKYK